MRVVPATEEAPGNRNSRRVGWSLYAHINKTMPPDDEGSVLNCCVATVGCGSRRATAVLSFTGTGRGIGRCASLQACRVRVGIGSGHALV
jgi:hypothetical protein